MIPDLLGECRWITIRESLVLLQRFSLSFLRVFRPDIVFLRG
jgi:hypothetical protein